MFLHIRFTKRNPSAPRACLLTLGSRRHKAEMDHGENVRIIISLSSWEKGRRKNSSPNTHACEDRGYNPTEKEQYQESRRCLRVENRKTEEKQSFCKLLGTSAG